MPTAITDFADYLDGGIQIITDLNLLPVITVGALMFVAFRLYRRARAG